MGLSRAIIIIKMGTRLMMQDKVVKQKDAEDTYNSLILNWLWK